MFLCFSKTPGGWLGILGMRGEERPMQGSVAHAWLHAVKHTKTLNFDLNLRVSGGVCGSIGVKQGVLPGGDCDSKVVDWADRSPCFSD